MPLLRLAVPFTRRGCFAHSHSLDHRNRASVYMAGHQSSMDLGIAQFSFTLPLQALTGP